MFKDDVPEAYPPDPTHLLITKQSCCKTDKLNWIHARDVANLFFFLIWVELWPFFRDLGKIVFSEDS